jgi:hypothetical protein
MHRDDEANIIDNYPPRDYYPTDSYRRSASDRNYDQAGRDYDIPESYPIDN